MLSRVHVRSMRLLDFDLRVVEPTAPGGVPGAPVVVLLHGFSMRADDLAPFGASMGLPAVFVFPEGPIDLALVPRHPASARLAGRAWWMIDVAARDLAIARGDDRDLAAQRPAGLGPAREGLSRLVGEVTRTWPGRPVFLGGFSQGAILSLDLVLRGLFRPAGLVLLSGGRVEAGATPDLGHARGIPVFQSHGTKDRELSFAAASTLSNDLVTAGADASWWPFEGGHEIPLPILRELKKFIRKHAETPKTSLEK